MSVRASSLPLVSTERARFIAHERLRDRRFWFVQAGIVAVSIFHIVLEWSGADHAEAGRALGLDEWPVLLYIVPVVYAGFVFGREGGLLAGLESALLATPMLLIWHRHEYAWTGELVYIGIVVGIGVAITIPVERERHERRRAEVNAARLALLDDVAMELAEAPALDEAVASALDLVVANMAVHRASVRGRGGDEALAVERSAPPEPEHDREIAGADALQSLHVPLVAGTEVVGDLSVVAVAGLEAEDRDLLGAIASHIGLAIETVRRREAEHEGLRRYVHEVTKALEDERTRLARELHDDAAQALVALCRGLDELCEAADDPASTARAIGGLRVLAAETLESIRRFSRALRPGVLDDLGLVAALDWLVADFSQRSGVEARFERVGEERRLAGEVELALFRITQEALNNAEKHADACDVVVSVVFEPHRLELRIADDGCGFVPPDPLVGLADQAQLGLIGMSERAALVGATLGLSSGPGRGTVVTVGLAGA